MINQAAKQTKFMLRLLLSIIIFCISIGFLSLFLQNFLLHRTVTTFEQQIQNDKNRIHIERYIIEDLQKLRSNFYGTLVVFNTKSEDYFIAQIKAITAELMDGLNVIEKGGDFMKDIPLNLPELDFLVDTISYAPIGQDKYIEEILVLRVLISDINDQIPKLQKLLKLRHLAHTGALSPKEVSGQMNQFFKRLDSQFRRMEEYANKIFYDSTLHMEKVNREIAVRKQQFIQMGVFSSVFVILIVTILGLLISKRIIAKTISAVREEEKKFRTIADFSNDWDEWVLADTSYAYVSPACERITGYSRDEFLQNPNLVLDIVHPDDRKKVYNHRLNYFVPDSQKNELDFRIIRKDGQVRWIWHQCQPLFDSNENWSGRRTTNRDMTSLHEAQKDLRMNEQRLMLALQGGELGLWDWNIKTGEFFCNRRWFEMLEFEPDEMETNFESWEKIIHPDDLAKVMEKLDRHLRGESNYYETEYRLRAKSGRWIWVFSKAKVIDYDTANKPLRVVGTNLDATDRHNREIKKRESVLQQEQIRRLKSLDIMAGAVAHRFNNSMMSVLGNLQLIHLNLDSDSQNKDMVASALKSAEGASRIGTMMLTYVGQGTPHLNPANLVKLVRETVTELEDQFLPSITVKWIPHPDALFCEMDKKQLKEVLVSIINNAIKSIGSAEGSIEISFGEEHFTADSFPMVFREDKPADGVYVYCQAVDTGCGIPKDDLTRIFEPFFTTKFIGRGLGLAMATGIMRSHGGALTAESTLGKGTIVRVVLPGLPHEAKTAELAELAEQKNSAVEAESIQFAGTVLLADDDELVLDVESRLLERLGFTVLTAVNGIKAVEQTDKYAQKIQAVILDVSMPEMDGIEAMNVIREKHPNIPILLSSGYSEDEIASKSGSGNKADGFLHKPFRLNVLEAKLKKILTAISFTG